MPFKLRLLPRSTTIVDLVKQGAAKARSELRDFDFETKVTFENAQSVSLDMPIAHSEKS